MKANVILTIVILLAVVAVSYEIGRRKGVQTAIVKGDAQFRIAVFHGLYLTAQRGDLASVQSNLASFLLGEVRAYQYRFGQETGTNFGERFAEAKQIADRVERQLIPLSSVLTNVPHSPNVKITIEQEKK